MGCQVEDNPSVSINFKKAWGCAEFWGRFSLCSLVFCRPGCSQICSDPSASDSQPYNYSETLSKNKNKNNPQNRQAWGILSFTPNHLSRLSCLWDSRKVALQIVFRKRTMLWMLRSWSWRDFFLNLGSYRRIWKYKQNNMKKGRGSKIKEQDFSKKYRKVKVRNEKIRVYTYLATQLYMERWNREYILHPYWKFCFPWAIKY